MNKKRIISIAIKIFLLIIFIIILKTSSSYGVGKILYDYKIGEDGSLTLKYDTDTETYYPGLFEGTLSWIKNINSNDTIYLADQGKGNKPSFYCVSKDYKADLSTKGCYVKKAYIDITPKGYGYTSVGDTYVGGQSGSYMLTEWNEDANIEYYYKLLYYLVSEGTPDKGYSISGIRQNAIWEYINGIMKNIVGFKPQVSEDNAAMDQVSIGTSYKSFVKDAIMFAKDKKVTKTVRIWYLEDYTDAPSGSNRDFAQSFLAVAIDEGGGTPDPTPDPTPKVSLKITKRGTNGLPLSNVQFALTTTKGSDNNWIYAGWTNGNGECTINNINAGKTYYIYETYNGNSGYRLSEQNGYDENIGRVYIGYLKAEKGAYSISATNKKSGSITLKKRIAQGGGVLSGVAFDLIEGHYESGSYSGKTYWTDSNGEISITGLELNKEYTLRETNFKSNKNTYLMNTGQLVYVKLTDSNPDQSINVWNNQYGGLEIEKINMVLYIIVYLVCMLLLLNIDLV